QPPAHASAMATRWSLDSSASRLPALGFVLFDVKLSDLASVGCSVGFGFTYHTMPNSDLSDRLKARRGLAPKDPTALGGFRIPTALPSLVTKVVELIFRFWAVKPLESVFNSCIVEPLKDLAQIGFELKFKCDGAPAAEISGAGEFARAFLQML